eukprot:TRINITY_DN6059_c0_g1_i2.p1 TRINITY_DN6059_c0_g1~~TRINITY_DN6059_c0_g1_i2.p1  ORF type:complete len:311 (-),score=39.21 TRINITY_DN6059_c0_g1_i2:24-956(-)
MVRYLGKCQHPSGGFGGGPAQVPHLAATYAAVHALVICGTQAAFDIIDREKLYQFLMKMKQPDGSFRMQHQGEIDVRGCYCALSVASLCNLMTPELVRGTGEWIATCQSYEGGLAGVPFGEAHGGYTFCGYAALFLANGMHLIDQAALLKWCCLRQMPVEGGFQGRSNKLVDGCYSFWQGGAFPLIDLAFMNPEKYQNFETCEIKREGMFGDSGWAFDQEALQKYLLGACQDTLTGGLMDKPGKGKDYYHTCYCLSGLSVAQNNPFYLAEPTILGDEENLLQATHPLYNICPQAVQRAIEYFGTLPVPGM